MNKLQFPETLLPGLFFNDYLNNAPLLEIYSVNAVKTEQHGHIILLYLNEEDDKAYLAYSDSGMEIKSVAYDLYEEKTALELNWFISGHMYCALKSDAIQVYTHPSGISLTIAKHVEGFFTYLLLIEEG